MPLQAWNGLDDFGKVVSKHGSFAAIFVIFFETQAAVAVGPPSQKACRTSNWQWIRTTRQQNWL